MLPSELCAETGMPARDAVIEQSIQRAERRLLVQAPRDSATEQPREAPAIPSPWAVPAGQRTPAPPAIPDADDAVEMTGQPEAPSGQAFLAPEDLFDINGGYRMSAGFTRDELILRNANGDLNERNFRIIGREHMTENTFDPGIYSRLWFDVDTANEEGWNMHAKVVIDPWSFTGQTEKFTVFGQGGDSATMQLKWWGANNRTINHTVFTQENGDGFDVPEIKVDDGHTTATTVTSKFNNTFNIPERDLNFTFQPVREFWFDYSSDTTHVRLFPAAYEDQAITSSDPLQLSNHHIYWEPSPWMDEWRPGIVHSGATPVDFTRGAWSDELTFATRDSDLQRLSMLRGTTFLWQPSDLFSFQTAVASPKTLWEDYSTFNRFVGMSRVNYQAAEWMSVGGTYTTRWGYNDRALDAFNHVYSVDTSVTPMEGIEFEAQMATSRASQDRTTDYKSATRGHAWHTALELGGGAGEALTEVEKEEGEAPTRYRLRTYYTHMDETFDPGLASYRETRDDTFWGRHLTFYRPLSQYRREMQPLQKAFVIDEDVAAFRIGDGVDVGRDVVGARFNTKLFDERIESLYDVRRVQDTDNQYIETVMRTEQQWRVTSRLTSKFLFLYHDRPHSEGVDPFVADSASNLFRDNVLSPDANPSTMTFSTGLDYIFTDNLAGWLVYERTQDIPFGGSDSHARWLFKDFNFTTFNVDGQTIRRQTVFLYNNGQFPLAPYPWFDIYKAGMHWRVRDVLEGNITWTRNEYEFADQIDDNMNHIGFEMALHPSDRMTLAGKYTLSQSIDLARLNGGGDSVNARHHNLYVQGRYRVTEQSEFVAEYGVGSIIPPANVFTVSPFGQYFPVLDTVHMVRVSYTAKF